MAVEHLDRCKESFLGGSHFPADKGASAVTLGVFDGVHRGHRRLIEALKERAQSSGLRSVVVTFRNHPLSVLRPDFEPSYLSTVERRIALLEDTGVDEVAAVDFTSETANVSAADFVKLMCERLGMKALVVGPDFALGRNRQGDIDFLRDTGRRAGFRLEVVEPLAQDGHRIDSTGIRRALSAGDVTGAARLLGRNYELAGEVVVGRGRGGPLGFPTANLRTAENLSVPANGIYAAWAHVGRVPGDCGPAKMMCATSIGTNPTFGESERTVEAFMLDFKGDLYGSSVTLEFVRRLRDEERFASVQALKEQVGRDVEITRAVLGGGQ